MTASIVQGVLKRYLNKWLKNVTTQQAGLLDGEVVLRDVELRVDTLQEELHLPEGFVFDRAFVHTLHVYIPLANLLREPISLTLSNVEIVARPPDPNTPTPDPKPDSKPAHRPADEEPERPSSNKSSGWGSSMLKSIQKNISLEINNLVLKYCTESYVSSFSCKSAFFTPCNSLWEPEWCDGEGETHPFFKKFVVEDATWSLDVVDSDGLVRSYEAPLFNRETLEVRTISRDHPDGDTSRGEAIGLPHKQVDIELETFHLLISDKQLGLLSKFVSEIQEMMNKISGKRKPPSEGANYLGEEAAHSSHERPLNPSPEGASLQNPPSSPASTQISSPKTLVKSITSFTLRQWSVTLQRAIHNPSAVLSQQERLRVFGSGVTFLNRRDWPSGAPGVPGGGDRKQAKGSPSRVENGARQTHSLEDIRVSIVDLRATHECGSGRSVLFGFGTGNAGMSASQQSSFQAGHFSSFKSAGQDAATSHPVHNGAASLFGEDALDDENPYESRRVARKLASLFSGPLSEASMALGEEAAGNLLQSLMGRDSEDVANRLLRRARGEEVSMLSVVGDGWSHSDSAACLFAFSKLSTEPSEDDIWLPPAEENRQWIKFHLQPFFVQVSCRAQASLAAFADCWKVPTMDISHDAKDTTFKRTDSGRQVYQTKKRKPPAALLLDVQIGEISAMVCCDEILREKYQRSLLVLSGRMQLKVCDAAQQSSRGQNGAPTHVPQSSEKHYAGSIQALQVLLGYRSIDTGVLSGLDVSGQGEASRGPRTVLWTTTPLALKGFRQLKKSPKGPEEHFDGSVVLEEMVGRLNQNDLVDLAVIVQSLSLQAQRKQWQKGANLADRHRPAAQQGPSRSLFGDQGESGERVSEFHIRGLMLSARKAGEALSGIFDLQYINLQSPWLFLSALQETTGVSQQGSTQQPAHVPSAFNCEVTVRPSASGTTENVGGKVSSFLKMMRRNFSSKINSQRISVSITSQGFAQFLESITEFLPSRDDHANVGSQQDLTRSQVSDGGWSYASDAGDPTEEAPTKMPEALNQIRYLKEQNSILRQALMSNYSREDRDIDSSFDEELMHSSTPFSPESAHERIPDMRINLESAMYCSSCQRSKRPDYCQILLNEASAWRRAVVRLSRNLSGSFAGDISKIRRDMRRPWPLIILLVGYAGMLHVVIAMLLHTMAVAENPLVKRLA